MDLQFDGGGKREKARTAMGQYRATLFKTRTAAELYTADLAIQVAWTYPKLVRHFKGFVDVTT